MHAYPTAFVVKEAGSTWNTKEIINVFSFRGYLRKEELFTITGGSGRNFNPEQYFYSLIYPDPDDPGYYISFYDDFWDPNNPVGVTNYYKQGNKKWMEDVWLYSLDLGTKAHNSLFNSWYMNMIRTSESQFAEDIREILDL